MYTKSKYIIFTHCQHCSRSSSPKWAQARKALIAGASAFGGGARALDALVAASRVAPTAHQVGDEDQQDGAGQGAANHNRNHVTTEEEEGMTTKKLRYLFYFGSF